MPQTDDPFYSSPTLDGGATDEDSFEATGGAYPESSSTGEIQLGLSENVGYIMVYSQWNSHLL